MGSLSERVMEERRAIPRTRILKGARIILNRRSSTISCIVRNLTTSGARLDIASTAGIPAKFELSFENRCLSRRSCRVVWRGDDKIGVAFERTQALVAVVTAIVV